MEWVVLVHVLSATVWVGGTIYVESLMGTAAKSRDPQTIMTIGYRVAQTNARLFTVVGLSTLVSGAWIVTDSVYEWEMLFVTVGFVAAIAGLTLGFFYFKPKLAQITALVEEKGLTDPETIATARSAGNMAHLQTLLVTVALILMVLKPGL